MTNSDRLQEIRERAEKATRGPWSARTITRYIKDNDPERGILGPNNENAICWIADEFEDSESNDDFIAEARSDIPYLLQLVTEQQREIARCRKALEAVNEFAKEDDICTHKTIGEQHGWGACFVCLIQATAQGALRGENGPFESDDEPEAKGYRKQERPI